MNESVVLTQAEYEKIKWQGLAKANVLYVVKQDDGRLVGHIGDTILYCDEQE